MQRNAGWYARRLVLQMWLKTWWQPRAVCVCVCARACVCVAPMVVVVVMAAAVVVGND